MGKRKKKEANLNMPRKKRADELAAAEAKEAEEEARLREASSDVPMADLVASFADELRCQLCSEIFEDPCTLPCGHNFCRACAEERLHGKGVYKNECPHERCTQPCYVKDLERNHTIASIVATLRDAVAPFAAGFDRSRGREPSAARADANHGKKNADAGRDDERGDADGVPTTEDGVPTTTEDGVPTTTEECGRLAEEIREIDAVANYLRRELEKIRAARAAKAARAAEDAAAARGDQTQTQTQTQTQRGSTQALGQCARLNMTQARHLYLMAHGEAPKRGATLKKLRAAAAKLDPDVVAAVLGAEDEVQVAGSNPDGDEERTRNARNARNDANRRRRETVAAEGVAAAAVPAGERRRARGDAAAAPCRVFTFTRSSGGKENDGDGNVSESNKTRFAADVARLNRLDPDGRVAVYAEEAGASTPLPPSVTHLLFDNGRRFDNFLDSSRIVAKRTVRYLEAILRGIWVLHVDYMKDSASAGRWLDEREYELRDAGIANGAFAAAINKNGQKTDKNVDDLGPPGGRKRAAAGAAGVFAGERVRVVSLPADVPVTLAEFTRLLEAGGAVVLNRENRLSVGIRVGGRSSASPPRASCDQDQVPESQPFDGTCGGTPGTGGGGKGEGSGSLGLTLNSGHEPPTVVVGELSDDEDAAGRGVAVDWHWVFHSIVHHRALDKEPYRRALLDAGGKGRE